MIYITGATGFIGSRVARRLIARGEQVRCLVRSEARGADLRALGAELIVGDVADRAIHEQGLHGAATAIHLAAIYEIGIVDGRELQRVNTDGTRSFLAAAAQARTPRVVFISTSAALGPMDQEQAEPRDAYHGPYPSEYHRTKADAHRSARDAQRNGQPVIIVCPSFVYGPGDTGPAGRFVAELVDRKVPALLSRPAWFSYVFVDDVAVGIIAALDRGMPGEVYVLSGEAASVNDYAQRVAELAHVKPPRLRVPATPARWASVLLDLIARATGLRFPMSVEAVKVGGIDRWLHTHERASRDLGYQPRSLADGLPETVAWAIKDGKP
jgi:dihydroflavonol-4-reductase